MPVDCTTARRFAMLCFRGVRRSLAHTRGEPRNRWHRTIRVTRGNLGTQCCVLLFVCYLSSNACRRRPYRVECTGSLPTSEVKRRRARLVLGWGTAWEHLRVLSAFVANLIRHHWGGATSEYLCRIERLRFACWSCRSLDSPPSAPWEHRCGVGA